MNVRCVLRIVFFTAFCSAACGDAIVKNNVRRNAVAPEKSCGSCEAMLTFQDFDVEAFAKSVDNVLEGSEAEVVKRGRIINHHESGMLALLLGLTYLTFIIGFAVFAGVRYYLEVRDRAEGDLKRASTVAF